MDETGIELRALTTADLAAAQRLSAAVGWPHRREDWQMVLELGQGLVAVDGAQVIGTAMWWTFDDRTARIGMIIVDPARQQSGVGRRLMDAVFVATQGMTLQLDATAAGVPLYLRLGFRQVGSIMQHQGSAQPGAPPCAPDRGLLRPAAAGDAAALVDLDRRAQGRARPAVLAALLRLGDAVVLERDGEIGGFAVVRDFGRGRLAGPVVAGDIGQAKALIDALIASHRGRFLRIDVRETAGLGPWLADRGLAAVEPAFTMVRGPLAPVSGDATCYAVVNQALG